MSAADIYANSCQKFRTGLILLTVSIQIDTLEFTIIRIFSINSFGCGIVIMMVLQFPVQCLAGEYTPPGLYDVDYYQLTNGLHILLKERHQARTVSYRIIVNSGTADFSCGRKETPHFLEHLLFTGTSKHTESELDDLIEGLGGSWNATTYSDKTVYDLDIFSKYSGPGLDTLYEIITDSLITQKNVDKSRDIIHRESGGKPSVFKQWFYNNGMGKTGGLLAHDMLLAGTPYICKKIEIADDIKRADILDAYSRFYVPNNMTIIVVGDFDSSVMRKKITSTFGTLTKGKSNIREKSFQIPNKKELLLTSTLSPIFDNEAYVGVAYATAGTQSPDYYSMWFIEKYLHDKLYKNIRIKEGKSYSPTARSIEYSDAGILMALADTELSEMDNVVKMIQHEIDQIVQYPVKEETFSLLKTKLLMTIVQGYESNSGTADYYVSSLRELQKNGFLTKEEEKIKALSIAEIQRVANKYLGSTPRLVFHNSPTMTYTQLGMTLGIILLVIIIFIIRYIYGHRKKTFST